MRRNYSSTFLLTALLLCYGCITSNRFSDTTLVETTPLKHQKATGQCWSFATTSFLEAEAKRLGYDIPELSSFFFVYQNYLDNAQEYLRNSGKSHLNNGDLTFSVLEIFKKHGAVPEAVYNGNLANVNTKKEMLNRWAEEDEMNLKIKQKLDSVLKTSVDTIKAITEVKSLLDSYMGATPKTFEYRGELLTPNSFANKYVPLDSENYLELTSYTHHPFYNNIVLEIPANWRMKTYLNLPIEDFMNTIDTGIKSGFTLAWDGDIGNNGGFKDNGYVRVKGEYENANLITQAQRQSAYERKTTTDDHNMHIVGITYDRNGEKFYILKNTWGENRGIDGSWYLSENYFRLRTISVTIHKEGIPNEILTKIGT